MKLIGIDILALESLKRLKFDLTKQMSPSSPSRPKTKKMIPKQNIKQE